MTTVRDTQLKLVAAAQDASAYPSPAARRGRDLRHGGYGDVGGAELPPRKRLREYIRFGSLGSFLLYVILPTLIVAGYYFFVASPQYASETTFVVRSSSQQALTGLGSILRSTVMGASQEPSYSITEYIKSRDALARLNREVGFAGLLARPEADFLSRFPNMISGSSQEDLYDAYQKFVSALYDPSTGVTTLTVRAFRPEDAQKIASSLMSGSEELVNRMNDRARNDAIDLAQKEAERSKRNVEDIQVRMTEYQVREGVLDPQANSKGTVELIAGLNKELADTQAALAQVRTFSPESPQVRSLQARANTLQQQIAAQRAAVIGPDGHVAQSVAQFQRLMLDRDFAEKELAAATASLDVARSDALRKQVYLERISEPSLADRSRYPKRLVDTLTVFVAIFIIYAIVWLLLANVREHAS